MKNFFRKVAFGIGPNEEVPSDPLAWALNQLDDVPDLTWKGRIPPGKEMIEKYAPESGVRKLEKCIETLIMKLNLYSMTNDSKNLSRKEEIKIEKPYKICLLYTSPSPRDRTRSRMPSSA